MYKVIIEDKARKELKKMDKFQMKIVLRWIRNNLEGIDDPRKIGKALEGELSDKWRYRVGNYRILAQIIDDKVLIKVVKIGHRKNVYK